MVGSHNSLTYMSTKNVFMGLFKFFYRCQTKTLEQQLQYGIRCFDVRVKLDNDWNWCFAHGIVKFKTNVYQIFDILNSNKCHVRLIFEEKEGKGYHNLAFVQLCSELEKKYPNIKFFEGRIKSSWKKLYTFKYENINQTTDQFVGSMQSKIIGKISPRLWDWFNHKKSRQLADESKADIILLDFI